MYAVNFLPWREQRRRACLRFWGLMFSAPAMVALTMLAIGGVIQSVNGQIATALVEAERQLATALGVAKPRMEARQQRLQQLISREARRNATRRWQPELENLARRLPAQAWLTKMDYQQSTLQLSGKALTFAALSALEAMLRGSQAWRITHTGAAQQDAQGYWQFHYRLAWRETDGGAR